MRLLSSDRALVELCPIGYQFSQAGGTETEEADCTGESYDNWDANWLVIQGDVRAADGRSWSKDPVCDLVYLPAEEWAARTGWAPAGAPG